MAARVLVYLADTADDGTNILITGGNDIKAIVSGTGAADSASVIITANGSVTIRDTTVDATVLAGGDSASIGVTADTGDIIINPATILAEDLDGIATITLTATDGAITVNDSGITAEVTDTTGTGRNRHC